MSPWSRHSAGATSPTRIAGVTATVEPGTAPASAPEVLWFLYLSPRTVGAHLYRAFPKLGITSRAALRDALSTFEAGTDRQSSDRFEPALMDGPLKAPTA